MTCRHLVLAAFAVLFSLTATACSADIGWGIRDTKTGAEWVTFEVASTQTVGGTTVLVESDQWIILGRGKRITVFSAEYRAICRLLGVETLAGHAIEYRIDGDPRLARRGPAGAIRLAIQGNPGQIRLWAR